MAYPPEKRALAIKLRVEHQLGLSDIAHQLAISKGTASLWLRGWPLPADVKRDRAARGGGSTRGRRKTDPALEAPKIRDMARGQSYTTSQMGAIAEVAVLLRLYLHKFQVFRAITDGAKADWVVLDPTTGRTVKLQVKCVQPARDGRGLPTVDLRCGAGTNNGAGPARQRRYEQNEVDFIIGYDLHTDTCYVWGYDETLGHTSAISIEVAAAERWDKLRV